MGSMVDFFEKPPGTTVRMRAKPNAKVVAFVVFVRKWTSSGSKPEATWHSDQLQNGGATLLVDSVRGYDFILKASIASGGGAGIDVQFDFDAPSPGAKSYPVELPLSEAPVVERYWSLVIR